MQLKTFSARSTSAVLSQIKEELGPDAIILDTREEDGMISITAARERKAGKELIARKLLVPATDEDEEHAAKVEEQRKAANAEAKAKAAGGASSAKA